MSTPLHGGRGLRRRTQTRWEKSIPQSYIDWHSRKGSGLQVRTRNEGPSTGAQSEGLILALGPGLRRATGPKCLKALPSCSGAAKVLFPDIREALEASFGLGHDLKLTTVLCYPPQGCVRGSHQPLPHLAPGPTSGPALSWALAGAHGWPCAWRPQLGWVWQSFWLPPRAWEGGLFLPLACELWLQVMKDSSLSFEKALGLSPFPLHTGSYLCLEHSPTAPFYLTNSYSSFMSQFKCHFLGNNFSTPIILAQYILCFFYSAFITSYYTCVCVF